MNSDAWDDDDQDQSRPRPKIDIGENVRVLKPAPATPGARKKVWTLFLVLFVGIIGGGIELLLNVPDDTWHHGLPPVAVFVIMGGFLVATLIALPGLMKIGMEQATSELRIGDLGMEMVQTLAPGRPPMQVWAVLWKDLAGVKLNYRGGQDPYTGLNEGVAVTAKSGHTQFLRPADWVPADGQGMMPTNVGSALISDAKPSKRRQLEQSGLVQLLRQKGVEVGDDVPRPQDRLAAIIGLSLGIGAILAALIFSYFVEK